MDKKRIHQRGHPSLASCMRSDENRRATIYILCGRERVWQECHTHKHVCILIICFALFCFVITSMAVCRYNVYRRVETLLKKLHSNKKISLDATFLPKRRKRVLNKQHTRVLNKPVKRAKAKDKVDAVLDSQVSISCLLHSPKKVAAPVEDSQCSVSRMHTHSQCTHTHFFRTHTPLPY